MQNYFGMPIAVNRLLRSEDLGSPHLLIRRSSSQTICFVSKTHNQILIGSFLRWRNWEEKK